MDARLITLKLFLSELGIPDDTSTVANRKMIQKAVYLGQYGGADLGYRFIWHHMGPFSANLARDYYKLSEAVALGEKDYETNVLRETKQRSLDAVKPILTPPADVKIGQPEWLELISSIHYLKKVSNLSDEEARQVLTKEKPNLVRFMDLAKAKLAEISVLQFNGIL